MQRISAVHLECDRAHSSWTSNAKMTSGKHETQNKIKRRTLSHKHLQEAPLLDSKGSPTLSNASPLRRGRATTREVCDFGPFRLFVGQNETKRLTPPHFCSKAAALSLTISRLFYFSPRDAEIAAGGERVRRRQ